ncbi:hypothetical protein [Kribbella sp. NPDC049584]|uniref:hypothetical protein n=1 Tax=Kribbella sp. NPDC049584 TaxID=3154833 RepID=UPI0034225BB1
MVGVLLLSACAHQADDTTPTPSSPTVVPLTVAQASKAALTVADLPKGWEGGVAPDRTPTLGLPITYDPADCQLLRDPLRDRETPSTTIRGQYFLRADSPSDDKVVTEVIASWPASQLPLVRNIVAVLPRCATFGGALEGETFKSFARQLPVPGLRDGIAIRFGDPKDRKLTSESYRAYVARGGTLLTLRAGSETFPTDAAFVRFVNTAVARLDVVG